VASGMKLTTHLHQVMTLRMNVAVPLLPLYASMAWIQTLYTVEVILTVVTKVCGFKTAFLLWSSVYASSHKQMELQKAIPLAVM
jgi:riboflavin transporter FmnP